ncbi:hypothetical protein CJ030_MR7G000047 [Morella rubra]|uniref:Uncharacterized protein n=1 Tax=Morella rubra TaxID=262757 RepID=A0A6A1V3S4_9ROSI|nr:hypothetical protein CJ030_MR7G000047 [Morella rubra]
MSSSRHTRSSQRTPASVGSKGKKKAGPPKNPLPLLKTTSTGQVSAKIVLFKTFEIEKLLLGDGLIFKWFSENGFGFQEMFEFQGWGTL